MNDCSCTHLDRESTQLMLIFNGALINICVRNNLLHLWSNEKHLTGMKENTVVVYRSKSLNCCMVNVDVQSK